MKNVAIYANKAIVTVYSQPSTKKQYEYDTLLQSEEIGLSTGQIFSNTTGKYVQFVRLGEAGFFYAKIEDISYNIEETLGNLLPTATIKSAKSKLPWIIGGSAAVIILIIILIAKR